MNYTGSKSEFNAAYRLLDELVSKSVFISGVYKIREELNPTDLNSNLEQKVSETPTTNQENIQYQKRKVTSEEKQGIYACIKAEIPDEDILTNYRISTGQLGSFKAHITMGNGKKKGDNGKIKPDDKESIVDLLTQGHTTKEIHELVEDEYSLQQIAGLKAALTKGQKTGNNGIREKILERDNYACQICGTTQEEHLDQYNHGLHMHHIDYNNNNNSENNLTMLCSVHHGDTNTVQKGPEIREKLEAKISKICT